MWKEKLNQSREQLSQLLSSFDWQQTREKVTQESRARIMLLGLPEAGKSTLFNHVCGWDVSTAPVEPLLDAAAMEDYGLFCLIDLPEQPDGAELYPLNGGLGGRDHLMSDLYPPLYSLGVETDPLELAENADLLLYVLDGPRGVRPPDYRWVGRLRRLGAPLLVLLNKCDQLDDDLERRLAQAEARLGTAVLPVSALTGANVADRLLPKMVHLCPELAVALGRELRVFRRQAARRLIHRAAVLNGLVALEPLPLLDLPVQLMTLTGMMMRLGAIYDHNANRARRREMGLALAGGLAGRYGAQQLAKLVPVVGWVVSGAIGWSCTWALGEAAIAYFEAGGDAAVDRRWQKTRGGSQSVGSGGGSLLAAAPAIDGDVDAPEGASWLSRRRRRMSESLFWPAPSPDSLQAGPRRPLDRVDAAALFSMAALRRAWLKVKATGGGPGIDGMSLGKFEKRLDDNLAQLRREILAGDYRPQPVKRLLAPKRKGGLRPLALWSLRDKVAQRVVYDCIEPYFESRFLGCSFGFRPGRGRDDVVKAIVAQRQAHRRWVADIDIKACFDNLDSKLVLKLVQQRVRDRLIVGLIRAWLNARVFNELSGQSATAGASQGAVISPLLANVVLHQVDLRLVKQKYHLIRYADDMVICCRRKQEAEQALEATAAALRQVKLELSPHKSRVVHFDQGFKFIGVFFVGNRHYIL